jgi:hypothetical protein
MAEGQELRWVGGSNQPQPAPGPTLTLVRPPFRGQEATGGCRYFDLVLYTAFRASTIVESPPPPTRPGTAYVQTGCHYFSIWVTWCCIRSLRRVYGSQRYVPLSVLRSSPPSGPASQVG